MASRQIPPAYAGVPKAHALLELAIREMPNGWVPRREDDMFLTVAFWDQEEFFAYSDHESEQLTKSISWVVDSYSQAWYQLAVMASKEKRFEDARSPGFSTPSLILLPTL